MIDYIKNNRKLFFVVLIGFIFLMVTIMPSGSRFCYEGECGMFFWGANGHDGIWHLSLIAAAFKQIPFILPVFKDGLLSGYNYLTDFILYLITLLGFSPQFLFFKVLPFGWFIGFCYFLIKVGRKIINNTTYIFWLLFFSFFGSSFAFFFPLYHKGTIWGGSSLVSMQSSQVLTNVQYALSLVVLLIIVYILKVKKLTIGWVSLVGFLLFINFGIKFYGGFVSAALVFSYLFFQYIQSSDRFRLKNIKSILIKYLSLSLFIVLAILLFYDPFKSLKTGSTFIFSPFATMHSIIEEPVLFYLKDMVNARYFLYSHGGFGPRLIFIELFSTALFLFFSLGLRIFGLIEIGIKIFKKNITKIELAMLSVAFSAFLFLILFVQKGDWWNVIQFYYYSLFILNFFTAAFIYRLSRLIKNKIIMGSIIAVIIIFTLPGNLDVLRTFLRFPAHAYIPDKELQALAFLKKQPRGVVLTQSQNKFLIKSNELNPIAVAEDSAYVSAFSSQQTFINDAIVLNITGVDFKSRAERLKSNDCTVLKEVAYIYEIKSNTDNYFKNCLHPQRKNFKVIFDNKEVVIYKMSSF